MTMAWSRRLLPLALVQIFLWLTLGLYTYGPWEWKMRSEGAFYAFVIGSHIAILAGYLTAAHRAPSAGPKRLDVERLLRISLWINLAVLPVTSYARTGTWIPDFINGIRNPGQAYALAHAFQETGGSNAGAYLRILASPWIVALFPLVVFFWGRLSWSTRSLALFVMLMVVLMSIATGQRRDIADLMITLPFVALGSHWAGVTRLARRTLVVGGLASVIVLSAFTGFFVYSHVSRVGQDTAAYGANPATRQLPNADNAMLQLLPAGAKPGFLGLVNYLTTGYYGLALSMDRDVKPMWGMGHSMFLTRNAAKFTNTPYFEAQSLPVQISDKDGFRYPVLWCTAYPYFASDVGWVGTVFLMFLLGRGLATSWIDLLGGKNPNAIVFFSLAAILAFYLPATNRMLQDGEGVAAFYVWLLAWALQRFRS